MLTCHAAGHLILPLPKNFRHISKDAATSQSNMGSKRLKMPKPASFVHWYLEPYCIGAKLRNLRTQKRLTLSRLAAETGLSTALLSKLETDRMVPTLPTLATISRVYGVGMSYFFSEPGQHSLSITRKAHLQSISRGTDALKTTPLHALAETDRIAAEILEIAAGGSSPAPESLAQSSGLLYVLEGRLQLSAGGLNEVLDAGDCVYSRTRMALNLSAVGKHSCRVLSVRPVAGHAEV
jgi:transcriptional regulator with XRE-family HTH domain